MKSLFLAAATAVGAIMAASGAAEELRIEAECSPGYPVEVVENLSEKTRMRWNLRYYEDDSSNIYVIADTKTVFIGIDDRTHEDSIWFLAVFEQDMTCIVAGNAEILSEFNELYSSELGIICSGIELNNDGVKAIENGVIRDYAAVGLLEGSVVVIETGPSEVEEYGNDTFVYRLLNSSDWHLLFNKGRTICWLAH